MKVTFQSIIIGFTLVFSLMSFPLEGETEKNVLATNAWTAAFAQAAGVEKVESLAPVDAVHPPEYELRPSDVKKIREANLLIYGGYENLMRSVFENFEKTEEELIKIETSYDPAVLRRSILAIAEKTHTKSEAERSLKELDGFFQRAIAILKEENLYGGKVFVHFYQRPLAEALGFDILGIFGPEPLRAKQIEELGNLNPRLIIDNVHNPLSLPLEEITKAPSAALINFPGYPIAGIPRITTLVDVLEYNFSRILVELGYPSRYTKEALIQKR